MSIARWVLAAAVVAVLGTGPAQAAEVYLNNTKVTGSIRNLAMPKVDVRFDDAGNVYIDAPGYKVEVAPAPTNPPPPGHYYLVVNVRAPGHYNIEVAANGKPVATIPAKSTEYFAELTDKLQVGPNGVLVTFLPTPEAPPVAEMEAVDLMVVKGEQAADRTLTVTRVLGTLKRKTGQRIAEAIPITFELR